MVDQAQVSCFKLGGNGRLAVRGWEFGRVVNMVALPEAQEVWEVDWPDGSKDLLLYQA